MVSEVDSDKLTETVGVGGGVMVTLSDSVGDTVIVFWEGLTESVAGIDSVCVCGCVAVGVTDGVGGIDSDRVTSRLLDKVVEPVMSNVADGVGIMETVREAVSVGGIEWE